jgi:hypothetical protein
MNFFSGFVFLSAHIDRRRQPKSASQDSPIAPRVHG